MLYTFGSASFKVLITKADGDYESEVTEVHIPGGSVNYVDIGGVLPNHMNLSLYFDAASGFTALGAMTSTSDTLSIHSGSYSDAVLVSLQRTWLNHDGEQSIADATFIIP